MVWKFKLVEAHSLERLPVIAKRDRILHYKQPPITPSGVPTIRRLPVTPYEADSYATRDRILTRSETVFIAKRSRDERQTKPDSTPNETEIAELSCRKDCRNWLLPLYCTY